MSNLRSPQDPAARGVAQGQVSIAVLVIALLLGSAAELKAYADPGTGALLWQSLMAMIAGVGYYMRKRFWARRNRGGQSND